MRLYDRLIGRLGVVTDVFIHAIRGEFLHSKDTVDDWKDSIRWLQQSIQPLEKLGEYLNEDLDKLSEKSNDARAERGRALAEVCSRHLEEFRTRLDQAVSAVTDFNDDVDARIPIFDAIDALDEAIEELTNWWYELADFKTSSNLFPARAFVSPAKPDRGEIDELIEKILGEFETANGLRGAVGNDPVSRDCDIKCCMWSRKLYLLAHYVALVHPDLWDDERDVRFRKSHESALKVIDGSSHYWNSTKHRLDIYEKSNVIHENR